MVKLYDASILTGLRSPVIGNSILPEGRSGEGVEHHISAPRDTVEITPQYPGNLIAGDLVSVDGKAYRVSKMYNLGMNATYLSGDQGALDALMIVMAGVQDPQSEMRLWVPYDGSLGMSPVPPGETITFLSVRSVETQLYANLGYFARDDDFGIDVGGTGGGPVTCFTTGTLIETDRGPCPVQRLRVGDRVRTRDHGFQTLRWLGGRQLSAAELATDAKLHPIRISAGALGPGLPTRDLVVSPQHRMLIRSAIAERMTGSTEVLIAAIHLLGHPGIERITPQGGLGYWHLMFDRHEIVFAEGAETESLHLGPMALEAMTDAAIEELRALFPDLLPPGDKAKPRPMARPVMHGKSVRKLIARQIKNFKPLVMGA